MFGHLISLQIAAVSSLGRTIQDPVPPVVGPFLTVGCQLRSTVPSERHLDGTEQSHTDRKIGMAMSVEQFFESYAQVLNRSVGEPEILDAVRAHLADSFVVATPDGLRCGQDGEFTETLRQMLEQCGFRLGVKWPAGPRAARRVRGRSPRRGWIELYISIHSSG